MENKFTELQAVRLAKKLHKITGYNVFENTRKRDYIEVRALFNFILYDAKGYTLHQIKKVYQDNGKSYDHSTALHSLKNFDTYKRYNQNYDDWIKEVLVDEYDTELMQKLISKKAKGLSFESLDKLYNKALKLYANERGIKDKDEVPEKQEVTDPLNKLKGRLVVAFREAEKNHENDELRAGLQEALKIMLNLEKQLN